jgi:hypothetical protein
MMYEKLIQQFMYEQFPAVPVDKEVLFESIYKAVVGTKQLRNGPMPLPEAAVAIRQVLRDNEKIVFHIPWGSRKLGERDMDILDFMALKQLYSVERLLAFYGRETKFVFRIEDLTDNWLFGEPSKEERDRYWLPVTTLIGRLFHNAWNYLESDLTDPKIFSGLAAQYTAIFHDYFLGKIQVGLIHELGWKGTIPTAQRQYYLRKFSRMGYADPLHELAKYFGATLARVNTKATATPSEPHISVSFIDPVPGNPISRQRVYYRSIPEKFTHLHCQPWNGRGYLVINEEGECTPRIVPYGEILNLAEEYVEFGGVKIRTDYLIES